MSLTQAIAERQGARATRANRRHQELVELRMDEQILIEQYRPHFADWSKADRHGDIRIETAFKRLYDVLDNEEQRDLLVQCYAHWVEDERAEERIVGQTQDHNQRHLSIHRGNTPKFVGRER